MLEFLQALNLIIGTANILMFARCVWMGYQTAKDRQNGGGKENQ